MFICGRFVVTRGPPSGQRWKHKGDLHPPKQPLFSLNCFSVTTRNSNIDVGRHKLIFLNLVMHFKNKNSYLNNRDLKVERGYIQLCW